MKTAIIVGKLSLTAVAFAVFGGASIEAKAEMDARCPNGSTPSFANNRLHCAGPTQNSDIACRNPAFPRYVAISQAAVGSERDVCAATTADGASISSNTNLAATRNELNACPAGFPNTVTHIGLPPTQPPLGPLCVRAGVTINPSTNVTTAGFVLNTDYRLRGSTQVAIFGANDFERVPLNGVRGNFSYVAAVPAAATVQQQGWALDLSGNSAVNRYQHVAKVDAILVPHQ